MKKLTSLMFVLLLGFSYTMAQVPSAFNYQAVVRNNSGELIADQNVSFRISILQNSESGAVVYTETHAAQTNSFGLVTLKIGMGTPVTGTFAPGNWGAAPHFLKVETDPAGGSAYTHMGTSQLLAVPYAFHAQTVENDKVNDADADPDNELQQLSISGTQLTLSDGGGTVTLPSSGGGDNWGTQTVVTDATLSGNGTTASPLKVVGDLSDNQTLSVSGNELSISDGNTVTLSGLWTGTSSAIYEPNKQVIIGATPNSGAKRKLQVFYTDGISIYAENNSTQYGSIFLINKGSGPAADFRNHIKIYDGTQGAGKVLTSDAAGNSSWQKPVQPLAYGTISSEGTILSSSGNITVSHPYAGRYDVAISGVTYIYSDYTCNITLINDIGFVKAMSDADKLVVITCDKDGNHSDFPFNFIVF